MFSIISSGGSELSLCSIAGTIPFDLLANLGVSF